MLLCAVFLLPRFLSHGNRPRLPASLRPAAHIRMSTLRRVLYIDTEALTVDVEGGATFASICASTLACACGPLLPTVVPSLSSITAGGAIAGVATSSTSFMNGCVHDSVLVSVAASCRCVRELCDAGMCSCSNWGFAFHFETLCVDSTRNMLKRPTSAEHCASLSCKLKVCFALKAGVYRYGTVCFCIWSMTRSQSIVFVLAAITCPCIP